MTRSLWRALAIGAGVTLGACASNPDVDPAEIERTESAILQAREAGSERHARRSLQMAEEQLMLARRQIDAGRDELAVRLLHEAHVLAELAEAESHARQAIRALEVIRVTLAALEAETDASAVPE
jgi:hypothetical protein